MYLFLEKYSTYVYIVHREWWNGVWILRKTCEIPLEQLCNNCVISSHTDSVRLINMLWDTAGAASSRHNGKYFWRGLVPNKNIDFGWYTLRMFKNWRRGHTYKKWTTHYYFVFQLFWINLKFIIGYGTLKVMIN